MRLSGLRKGDEHPDYAGLGVCHSFTFVYRNSRLRRWFLTSCYSRYTGIGSTALQAVLDAGYCYGRRDTGVSLSEHVCWS